MIKSHPPYPKINISNPKINKTQASSGWKLQITNRWKNVNRKIIR